MFIKIMALSSILLVLIAMAVVGVWMCSTNSSKGKHLTFAPTFRLVRGSHGDDLTFIIKFLLAIQIFWVIVLWAVTTNIIDRDVWPLKYRDTQFLGRLHLRHQLNEDLLTLSPKNFSIYDLPTPSVNTSWLLLHQGLLNTTDFMYADVVSKQLCMAAFSLDIAALKYLLYDIGVSPNLKFSGDYNRPVLHCLSVLGTMAGGHYNGQMFSTLRGESTFLTPMISSTIPIKLSTVTIPRILKATSSAIRNTTKWLLRSNADIFTQDINGNTFLHYASQGGLVGMIEEVLLGNWSPQKLAIEDMTKLVCIQNNFGRTALHYAAANSHISIIQLLIQFGGNIDTKDIYGVSVRDMALHGALSDNSIGILALPSKHLIDRKEYLSNRSRGGWNTQRLTGYEDDFACSDIDQYDSHEINGDILFTNYIARNTPVLIRGLIDKWPAILSYKKQNLIRNYGRVRVDVSDLPYPEHFGKTVRKVLTLSEYIVSQSNNSDNLPWYVFVGHEIPQDSERVDNPNTLVPYSICPTPLTIHNAVKRLFPGHRIPDAHDPLSRSMFVNAQWAYGGRGTGAAMHYHNSAWNALIYGAKKWIMYRPSHGVMSNLHIQDFIKNELPILERDWGMRPLTCTQLPGDIIIVPEGWAHGVLNIEESIAIATEFSTSHWRIKPGTKLPDYLNQA